LYTGTNQWTFGGDCDLTLPNGTVIGTPEGAGTTGIIAPIDTELLLETSRTASTTVINWAPPQGTNYPSQGGNILVTGGSGSGMNVQYAVSGGSVIAVSINIPGTGYQTGDILTIPAGDSNAVFEVEVRDALASTWSFNADGGTVFPTLTVDLHNGGNQTAQTLQFGDNTQQAIVTGPTPAVNTNAQRLIIQGQRASGTGEGGDVYLWAGDSDLYGGDIKIYAGDADNVSAGYGGYVNIAGGDGFDSGGYVRMTAGQSSNSQGPYAEIFGGQGTIGGFANIAGGYGSAGDGGNVNLIGGGSGNGLSQYGNVNITAGASTWAFDNTGNLVLPSGGSIFSVNSTPSGNPGNTITLQPAGSGITTNQKLLVYPTAADGDHIHMTSGNLYETELFLGSDNLYVKLANTGNVVVNSNDGNGNTAMWTFGTDGNLSLPGNLVINGLTNIFGSNTALIQTNDDIPLAMISSNANGTISSVWIENTSDIGNSNIAAMYLPELSSGAVRIVNGNNATTINVWDFGTDGVSQSPVLTVDALPSAVAGMRAFVSDSNLAPAGNFGAIVGNSGSNTTSVWSDGTNWYIG
jgi:hypothetical protein